MVWSLQERSHHDTHVNRYCSAHRHCRFCQRCHTPTSPTRDTPYTRPSHTCRQLRQPGRQYQCIRRHVPSSIVVGAFTSSLNAAKFLHHSGSPWQKSPAVCIAPPEKDPQYVDISYSVQSWDYMHVALSTCSFAREHATTMVAVLRPVTDGVAVHST
jgi:hypothetical protein